MEEPAKNLLRNRKTYIITAVAFTSVLVAIGIFIFSPKTAPVQDRPANGLQNNSTKTSAVNSKSAAKAADKAGSKSSVGSDLAENEAGGISGAADDPPIEGPPLGAALLKVSF